MKVLFLSSRPPYPPDRGDKLRTNFFLKEFSKNHDVYLFSFIEDETENNFKQALNKICKKVYFLKKSKLVSLFNLVKTIFTGKSFQVAYYYNNKGVKVLKKICNEVKPDIIYCHLIRMAPYVKHLDAKIKILDYTDCISREYARSLKHRKGLKKAFFTTETKRTHKYEEKIYKNFTQSWFITASDIQKLNLQNKKSVITVTNPVNICTKTFSYELKNKLVFVGNMSVPHNVHAASWVNQNIMPSLSNCTFNIIGANPSLAVKQLHNTNNTKVLGFVDDLYKSLFDNDIFIAPMFFSAGIQNKVLEAMACGIPVITTDAVCKSIGCANNKHLIVAKTKNEFIQKTKLLLSNKNLREEIGKNGKQFMIDNFAYNSVANIVNSTINKLIKNAK